MGVAPLSDQRRQKIAGVFLYSPPRLGQLKKLDSALPFNRMTCQSMQISAKDARRREMVGAATRVFARKGYHSASVADIIAEAGVARGTFYLYFGSKDEAFSAVLDGFIADMARNAEENARAQVPDTDVPRAVRRLFLDWLRFLSERRDAAAVVFQHGFSQDPHLKERCRAAFTSAYSAWEAKIAQHQAEGLTNPRIEPRVLRSALVGVFSQIALDALLREGRTDLEVLADQFLELLTSGVFVAPGGAR